MTRLHQLHERYGQSPGWTTSPAATSRAAVAPSGRPGHPGRHLQPNHHRQGHRQLGRLRRPARRPDRRRPGRRSQLLGARHLRPQRRPGRAAAHLRPHAAPWSSRDSPTPPPAPSWAGAVDVVARPLDRARRRHLGGPRRPTPLRRLQGHGLGRGRPSHPLARGLGLPADLDRWSALASTIRRQVEQAGVDPASGAFTQAFGSRAPDAANLLLPLVRFLPPDDPRIGATVERTARELAPQGLVHRYLGADDGLPGGEASFGSAASGWSTTSPSPARPTGPPCCSSGCSATPTTWGCWPRRSTRPAATCSATSPRPSVTSG
jgi:hypothetical protein